MESGIVAVPFIIPVPSDKNGEPVTIGVQFPEESLSSLHADITASDKITKRKIIGFVDNSPCK